MNRRFEQADAVYMHTQTAALFASGMMQRVPTVLSLDATPLLFDTLGGTYNHSRQAAPMEWIKFRANQRALTSARAIVTFSKWAARSVIDDYGVESDRVHVISPGVRIDKFQPRLNRPSSQPMRILFVGGDFVRKGGPELVEAVASLEDHVELDIVTSTPGIAVPRGAPIRLHYNVTQDSSELEELLARADVFALPTRGDCHSHATLEAMACGLPVLTTNVTSLPEIVRNGENGYMVPPGRPNEIAAALRVFASDACLRERMGRNGRALAEVEHDAAANWRKIFSLLHTISGHRQKS
jgi:glycosyltransferase involved in cell wall biosynthesis